MIYQEDRAHKNSFLTPHSGRTWTEKSRIYILTYRMDFDAIQSGQALVPVAVETPWQIDGAADPGTFLISGTLVSEGFSLTSRNRRYGIKDETVINMATGKLIRNLSGDQHYRDFVTRSESNYKEAYKNGHNDTWPNYRISGDGRFITATADTYLVPETDYFDFRRVHVFDVKNSAVSSFTIDMNNPNLSGINIKDIEYIKDSWVCLILFHEKNQAHAGLWSSESGLFRQIPLKYVSNVDTRSSYDYMTDMDRHDIWDHQNQFFAKIPGRRMLDKHNGKIEVIISSYKSNEIYRLFLDYDLKKDQ